MRHARIERWSRGKSFLHRRHPAAKLVAALILLVSIASLKGWASCLLFAILLISATVAARLPVLSVAAAAMVVMVPVLIPVTILTWAAGEPGRAGLFMARGYLSGLTAMLLAASTRMPDLLAGLEALYAPRFLLDVMQFLVRYLDLFIEEAGTMRQAALSRVGAITPPGVFSARNGRLSSLALGFRQATGAVAVLFARAHGRATAVHRAMLCRGFEGHLPALRSIRFRLTDAGLLAATTAIAAGIRTAFR